MQSLASESDTRAAFPLTGLLGRLSFFDWSAGGVAQPENWDEVLVAAVRLIDAACMPMALLIGREGLLVPNDAVRAIFGGRTDADLIALPILPALPESEIQVRDSLKRGLAGEASSLQAQPIKLGPGGTGKTGWFNFDFVPVLGRMGQPLALLVIATDVGDHIRRARDLSEAVGRLRLALEGSGMVGIWTMDAATSVCTCDASVARMFGLPVRDCEIGADVDRFIHAMHPADRERVAATLQTAIDTGKPYRARYRVEIPGEPLRWVIASGKPSFGEDGTLARLLGVIVDISDQMETAAALAESRFQFETLTETLPQIVWSCDAEGRHDYFSTRWSEFTGIVPEDITEESWKELVHPDDWPMVSREWGDAMREGKPYDIDYRFRHRSGAYRWLRVMALPIRDDKGTITRWFGTSTDVHDAYLLAEEREALRCEMERIATEDQLTGVLTRRAFVERAAHVIDQLQPATEPASLLMIDIDRFKSINDTYGHPNGDVVLAGAAQRIRNMLDDQCLVGRLGGEEFAVLLPRYPADEACRLAEKIRRAVDIEPFDCKGQSSLHVTISIGVTTVTTKPHGLDGLIGFADKALYQAKDRGRNRIIFLSDEVSFG